MSGRALLVYGGNAYTVADRDPDALREHITLRLADTPAFWLTVNATEGRFTRAQLLITATTDIAILDDGDVGHSTRFEAATSSTDDFPD